MKIALCSLASSCVALAFASAALAQGSMLAPPGNHFSSARGPGARPIRISGRCSASASMPRRNRHGGWSSRRAAGDRGDHRHRARLESQSIDSDKLWRNPKETADNGIDDDKNGYIDDVIGWDFFEGDAKPWDHDGHGTLVAGIIAGRLERETGMAGINPFARLMILKGLNNFGHTRSSYMAEAITYAADNGARVINFGRSARRSRAVEQAAIDYAFGKGVVIVVAPATKVPTSASMASPASDKVLTVAQHGLRRSARRSSRTGAGSRWRRRAWIS